MERGSIYYTLVFIVSFLPKTYASHRIFSCGLYNGYSAEYEAVIDGVINKTSGWKNVSLILRKYNNTSENIDLFHQASSFLDQNILVLIEGGNTKTHACALSTVTGIPLIRLHGESRTYEQCEKAIQMSAGYRDYGHAALDILNTFGWKTIALVFDEKSFHEVAYFLAISQNMELAVDLVQLIKRNENEDPKASVLGAMEEIKKVAVEAILLFVDKEIVELMVQQRPRQERGLINVYNWILLRKMPMNLHSHRDSIVLSLTLPFSQRSAPNELIKAWNTTNMDFAALAHDAVKVIKQAINRKPCRSINGTSISLNDKETMLTCLKKVSADGLTGPINFNERGTRTGLKLEILNLRNNSFKRVGTWNSTQGAILFDKISRNMANPSEAERLEGRRFRVVVAEVTPNCRVALRNDSYTLHKILPNKVDPLVSLMMVEKVPDSTYEMVGGLDKQIKEIKEVIELPVKHPELFEALGIDQPKGVLLYGPPGTGKTLLARAVAHHTECTFIRVSGSELVQKFIGEGARMVRELFVMAREHAPSIIFMDEIDSIGSSRLEGGSGGDSEVQRTMLELLNQLDGFEATKNIKVVMATNRIDILDSALLRPGRIDRKIEFPPPNEEARLDILKIHSRKMNLTRGINLRKIAELMPGSSGAEVKGVCTEAGMYALRERRVHVTQEDFEMAVTKVMQKDSEKNMSIKKLWK